MSIDQRLSISDLRAALCDTNTAAANEIDQSTIKMISAIRGGSTNIISTSGGHGPSGAMLITTGPGMLNDVVEFTGVSLTTSFKPDTPSLFSKKMCTDVGPSICTGSLIECAIPEAMEQIERQIREMCCMHTREDVTRLRDIAIQCNPSRVASRDPCGIVAFMVACVHDAFHSVATAPVCAETRKRASFARVTFACLRMCQSIYATPAVWIAPHRREYQSGSPGIGSIALALITHAFGANPNMFIPQVVFSISALLGPFSDSSRRAILLVHPGYSSIEEAEYHVSYLSRYIAVQAITSAVHAYGGIPFVPDLLIPTRSLVRAAGIQDIGCFTSVNDVYDWAMVKPERVVRGCPFPIAFRQPVLLRDGHIVDIYHGFSGSAVDYLMTDRFTPPINSPNNPLRNGATYAHYLRAWATRLGAMGVISVLQERKDSCNFVQDFRLSASQLYYGSATMDPRAPRHVEKVCNQGRSVLHGKSILYTTSTLSGVPFGPSPPPDSQIIILRRTGAGAVGANLAYQVARDTDVVNEFSFSDRRGSGLPLLPDGMSPGIHGSPFDQVSNSELELSDWGSVLVNRLGGAMPSPAPPSPIILPAAYESFDHAPDWSLRDRDAMVVAAAAKKKRHRPPRKAPDGSARPPRVRKPPAAAEGQGPPRKKARSSASKKKEGEEKAEDSV